MKRKLRKPTPDEEGAIQRGIAADPDNPEWTEADFTAALPAASYFAERRARADWAALDRLMARSGSQPPRPGDGLPSPPADRPLNRRGPAPPGGFVTGWRWD